MTSWIADIYYFSFRRDFAAPFAEDFFAAAFFGALLRGAAFLAALFFFGATARLLPRAVFAGADFFSAAARFTGLERFGFDVGSRSAIGASLCPSAPLSTRTT